MLVMILAMMLLASGCSQGSMTYVLPNGTEFKPEKATNGSEYRVPDNPQMPEKWIFTGWKFTSSETIGEESSEDESANVKKSGKNVVYAHAEARAVPIDETALALAGGYGTKGDRVTIPLKLCGDVNVCAFEVEIKYDPGQLKFKAFENVDAGVVVNAIEEEGLILLNYLDSSNTVGDVDLVDLVFEVTGKKATTTNVTMIVKNGTRYGEDNKLEDVNIVVIPSTVTIV